MAGNYFEYWEARTNLQTTKFFRLHYTGAMVISPAPTLGLQVQTQPNSLVLSWTPPVSGFTLETATNLVPPVTWWPVTNGAITVTNGQMEFIQSLEGPLPAQFFRLEGP